MWIDHEETNPKIAKLRQLGTGSGSRDLLLNFGTPSISKERLKIQTSNLVRRLRRSDLCKNFYIRSTGKQDLGNVTYILILDPLYNSATRRDRDFKFRMILYCLRHLHT